MTRKKKKESTRAGIYAMCVTVGVIVGLGLTPLTGNLLVMILIGAIAGTLAAYLIDKNSGRGPHKRHH